MNAIRILFTAALVLLGGGNCYSQTITWNGAGDGASWSDTNNWIGHQLPGLANNVVITTGAGTNVVIAAAVSVESIQCSKALTVSNTSLNLTAGTSSIQGVLTLSSATLLSADGSGTTLTSGGSVIADDANFGVSDGAGVLLAGLRNYTKSCSGANWTVTGSNSVLNLPGLTNITGQPCNFPIIQAEAGGQILATNLGTILAGPLAFQADGTNSLIDLGGLTNCSGQNPYLVTFEAGNGGTLRIPKMKGGPFLGVTINPGGSLSAAQLQTLYSLTVNGVAASFPALTNFDDGNVTVTGGAVVTFPVLRNFAKSCYGAYWTVTGSNSVLNLPALTNITGQSCDYPLIQAAAGGQILATNLASIQAGPLAFQADGTNSLIDLGGLINCSGQSPYSVTFEASDGGTLRIPNLRGGTFVDATLNPGGVMPTTQIQTLYNLTVSGAAIAFPALTNVAGILTVTSGTGSFPALATVTGGLAINAGSVNFPALTNFDDVNFTVSGGAVLNLPAVRNYTKSCNGAYWTVTGSNSVLNLPGLTNMTGKACNFPVIQAVAGGHILATNLGSILAGPLAFQADGTNSLIDLGGLTNCSGQNPYLVTFEASDGGTMRIPNMTGGPLVGVILNPGGSMPNAQIQALYNLTVNGVAANFPALTNFNDGNLVISAGAVVTLPALRNYTKSCNGANWTVTGSNSVLNLPGLTNMTGQACSFPVIQAAAGGQILAPNLSNILAGPLAFQADGANSLIDLSGLTVCSGQTPYLVTFEASAGGTLRIPNMTGGPFVGVTLNVGGSIPISQIQTLSSLNVDGVVTNFPALANFNGGSIMVSGGAVVSLPALLTYQAGCVNPVWQASGTGSTLQLTGLTSLQDSTCGGALAVEASGGGQVLLGGLQTIASGGVAFLADGAGSTIDLTSLSAFVLQSRPGSLTAQNGGTFLFGSQAFLLANVAITLPAGNPVLPPTLLASQTLTLYGTAWHSYQVQQRNTLQPGSPWTVFLVPLTNSFEALAPAPPANTVFVVSDFVANPPILQMELTPDLQAQMVLYGLPNAKYQIQTASNLLPKITWTPGSVVTMTNAFRIFPPMPPASVLQFYRAEQQ